MWKVYRWNCIGDIMINQNDDFDDDEDVEVKPKISRKKILLFLIPAMVVIGLIVGLYYTFNRDYGAGLNYSIVKNATDEDGNPTNGITVFYDLPEISARLKNANHRDDIVKIKINLELSNIEDVARVEALIPRINDAVISHTIELTADEVSGASGLYWLKEELLYRINLLISPIKVSNLNFKNFEIQTPDNN